MADAKAERAVSTIVTSALTGIVTQGDQFIINDSPWYYRKRKGGVSPCVVNSASFISKAFQSNLALHAGWQGETCIDGQDIDGFGVLPGEGLGYHLEKSDVVPFLEAYIRLSQLPEYELSRLFPLYYGMFVQRQCFSLDSIDTNLHDFFHKTAFSGEIKVGVEFETGNTASAYRAFNKLNNLFRKGEIDAGVFVTSIDKDSCSSRIWPSSNRNGSFQELERRKYQDNINLPMLELAFSPDDFSRKVEYLSESGGLYCPIKTEQVIEEALNKQRKQFEVYRGENGEELLKLIADEIGPCGEDRPKEH
ncbi:hypothetical protein [Endozoicomonas sp. 2B-B]